MKQALTLFVQAGWLVICLTACHGRLPAPPAFAFDPTVPYPLLNPGDFWPDTFDQRGLQNAVVHRDQLYCNTIDIGGPGNFLYCLNLRNGLVVWRAPVEAFATQPASFQGDTTVYCSYLGDISTFDRHGFSLWPTQQVTSYDEHWVDTTHARVLVTVVYWKHVYTYDIRSGKLLAKVTSDSLKQCVARAIRSSYPRQTYRYQFVRKGKQYRIVCEPAERGTSTVTIARQASSSEAAVRPL